MLQGEALYTLHANARCTTPWRFLIRGLEAEDVAAHHQATSSIIIRTGTALNALTTFEVHDLCIFPRQEVTHSGQHRRCRGMKPTLGYGGAGNVFCHQPLNDQLEDI